MTFSSVKLSLIFGGFNRNYLFVFNLENRVISSLALFSTSFLKPTGDFKQVR